MRMSRGAGTVLFVCACLLALNLTAVFVARQNSAPDSVGIWTSVAGAMLVPLFWLGSARLIDSGARRMGSQTGRHRFRDYSGRTYTILLIYASLAAAAAAAHRWVPAADPVLAVVIPVLALASIVWFLVAGIVAVRRVYDVPSLNAVTLAFLPYAALCSGLLIAIVLVSLASLVIR